MSSPTIFNVIPGFRRDQAAGGLSQAGFIAILSDAGPMLLVTPERMDDTARAVSAIMHGAEGATDPDSFRKSIWDGRKLVGQFGIACHMWARDGGQLSLIFTLGDDAGKGDFIPFVPAGMGKDGAKRLWSAFTELYGKGGVDEQMTRGDLSYDEIRAKYAHKL